MISTQNTPARIERFLANIVPDKTSDCLIWRGRKIDKHSVISWGCYQLGVHKIAYMLAKGPVPAGLVVRHTCDVKCCVNPDHLVLGTHAENIQDYWNRDPRAHKRRLDKANRAAAVRDLTDVMLKKDIAKLFNISPASITKILKETE